MLQVVNLTILFIAVKFFIIQYFNSLDVVKLKQDIEELDFLALRDEAINKVRQFREFVESVTMLTYNLQQKCMHSIVFEMSFPLCMLDGNLLPRRICCGCSLEEQFEPMSGWSILKNQPRKYLSPEDYWNYRENHPLKKPIKHAL